MRSVASGSRAREVVGVHGGDHDVVVAVGDECGLADVGEVVGRRQTVARDREQLRGGAGERDAGDPVRRALLQARDVRVLGAVTVGGVEEEQREAQVLAGSVASRKAARDGGGQARGAPVPPAGPVPARIMRRTS